MGGREVCKARRAEVLALKETAEKGMEKGASGGTEKGADNGVSAANGSIGKRGIGQGDGEGGGGGKRARFDSGLGLSTGVSKVLFKPLPLLRPAPVVRPVRRVITGATWVMLPSSTATS